MVAACAVGFSFFYSYLLVGPSLPFSISMPWALFIALVAMTGSAAYFGNLATKEFFLVTVMVILFYEISLDNS